MDFNIAKRDIDVLITVFLCHKTQHWRLDFG